MVVEWILLGLQVVAVLLLITFLGVFQRFYRLIAPLVERFSGVGSQAKVPTIREIIALAALKVIESIDFGKILGGLAGGPKK